MKTGDGVSFSVEGAAVRTVCLRDAGLGAGAELGNGGREPDGAESRWHILDPG